MKKTYKLDLEVALDDADEQKIIAAARLHFRSTGHAEAPVGEDGQTWRDISAEEVVPDTVEAIIELVCGNAALDDPGIELVSVSCNESKSGAAWQEPDENRAEAQVLRAGEADGQDASALDEFETGMSLKPVCTSVGGPTESSRLLGQRADGTHLFNSTNGRQRIRLTWFPWTSVW